METTVHALLGCRIARKVWRNSPLGRAIQGDKIADVMTLLKSLQQQYCELNGELVASLLWVTWNVINKLVFQGVSEDPARLVARAVSVVELVRRIKQPEGDFLTAETSTKQDQWCPPEEGWLKINVDAAMDVENQLAGSGAVIQNYKGEVIAAAVKSVKSFGDVEMEEAKAVLWGMQAAISARAVQVIIESDSKGVIELINNKRGTLIELLWMIFDILEIKKHFQNVKAQHVPRTCNKLAHSMAKLALSKSDPVVWLDEFSDDVAIILSK